MLLKEKFALPISSVQCSASELCKVFTIISIGISI